MTRKALGRGLSSLIPETPPAAPSAVPARAREFFHCPIAEIKPDPSQPRQNFAAKQLEQLVQSIQELGVVQPVVVRKNSDGYVLIAGERRWRAAQKAGLERIPAIVREVDNKRALELALVENIQRADLNPIEEAEAYQRLIDEHDYTQAELAQRIGKERSTIANSLRLLLLPDKVQQALINREISAGHARALLTLEDPAKMSRALAQMIAGRLSVRQAEAYVKRLAKDGTPRTKANVPSLSANARDLQQRLCQRLKTRVQLRPGRSSNGAGGNADSSGTIEIHYGSLDELDRLLQVLLP